MSDSSRVNISKTGLILGLLLAIAICVGWIGYGLSKSAEYERQADNQRSKYAQYTRNKIAETCVGISGIKLNKCRYEAFDAQREHANNQSDLVAQRQSALWASIMGAAAVIGISLSAIGVWLVKTTFDETRKSNDIAKSVSAGVLVPKFTFKGKSIIATDFSIELINIGQTPVRIIHKQIHSVQTPVDQQVTIPIDEDQIDSILLIDFSKAYLFPNHAMEDMPLIFRILCGAIYVDIFGKVEVCKAAFIVNKIERTYTVDEQADFSEWFKIAKQGKI
jgi:hypothetical protein